MKYVLRGLGIEEHFFQPPEYSAECILTPENDADRNVLSKLLMGYIVSADSSDSLPAIKNVYFNPPATVVLWDDGTKTVVKCQNSDTYSKETGLALCMAKKAMGNNGNYNEVFKKWIPEEKKPVHRNIDEWDKMENTYSDKLYRSVMEACAPKNVYRSCLNCTSRFYRCAKCDEDTLSMWELKK